VGPSDTTNLLAQINIGLKLDQLSLDAHLAENGFILEVRSIQKSQFKFYLLLHLLWEKAHLFRMKELV
jgi:hypothetical protein